MKKILKKLFLKFDLEIVRHSVLEELKNHKLACQTASDDIHL